MRTFIDIHAHAYRRPAPPVSKSGKPFPTPQQVLDRHAEIGVEKAVLLPLIGPEVYLAQSNEDILDMVEAFPGRFIPFCNIHPRAITNSPDAPLGDLLRYYRDKGCKGVGEVMPNVPFIDPMVQNLFKHVQDVGFPLTFYMADRIGRRSGLYDEPGLPQLQCCLERFPRGVRGTGSILFGTRFAT